MMSPLMVAVPRIDPNTLWEVGDAGINRATGRPRLVITSDSPVRSTSSIKDRHFALNSPAGIAFSGRFMTMVMTIVTSALSSTGRIAPEAKVL